MHSVRTRHIARKNAKKGGAPLLALYVLVVLLSACACATSTGTVSSRSGKTTIPARSLVIIDAKTGAIDVSIPDARGALSAISDTRYGWYVGGGFNRVGSTERNALAHLNSEGNLDGAFVPDMPKHDLVYAILLHRNVLFAACNTLGVIAFDARTGKRLWRVPTRGGRVQSLSYWKGILYVGGAFERIGHVRRSGIAAIDVATSKVTPWRVKTSAIVASVVVWKDVVYFGGMFDSVGGEKRPLGLAAVSARTGRPIAWVPKRKGAAGGIASVDKIFVTHGQVLAGSVVSGFAAFSARTGVALQWPRRLEGSAWVFDASGSTVYLGGIADAPFNRAGGKPAHSLASVVLPEGRFTNWRPNLGLCPGLYGLAVSGRKVLAVGSFWGPGGDVC
jgi:outer membrane protein assembly factor BamB